MSRAAALAAELGLRAVAAVSAVIVLAAVPGAVAFVLGLSLLTLAGRPGRLVRSK